MAFGYYAAVTIDNAKVSGTSCVDFPVLVSGTYAGASSAPDLRGTASGGKVTNANGYDIYFYSDSGLTTKLDHQLQSYVGTSGAILAWVKIPTLGTSADTTFYMAYGDSGISTSAGTATTWSANYDLVVHLDEAVNNDAGGYKDSGTAAINGTGVSMALTAVDAKVGKGQDFDPAADYIKFGDVYDKSATTPFSLSYWIKPDVVNINQLPLTKIDTTNFFGWQTFINTSGQADFIVLGTGTKYIEERTNTALGTGVWTHLFYTKSSGTSTAQQAMKIYINGTSTALTNLVNTLAGTCNTNTPAELNISGRNNGVQQMIDGKMDEVRVHSVERDAGWILTEYNTQADPSTFYAMGTQVATGTTAVSYRANTFSLMGIG